jgi:hypothetical protein
VLPHLAWRRNPLPEAFFEHPTGGRVSFVRCPS